MLQRMQVLLMIFFFVAQTLFAQQDSSLLRPVTIATKFRMDISHIGTIPQVINRKQLFLYQAQTLSNVLSAETGAYIKNYGLMGTSSISLRGMATQHTLVLWNGFPLESMTSGGSDLNLLNAGLTERIVIEKNGGSSLWGSAAIGGIVHFDTEQEKERGFHLQSTTHAGSFQMFQQSLKVSYVKPNYALQWKTFYRTGANNFLFYNTTKRNQPLDTLPRIPSLQFGILGENYFTLDSNKKIIFRLWAQSNERQLQPTMLTNISDASFSDQTIKTTIEYQHAYRSAYQYQIKTAWFKDDLTYQSPSILSVFKTQKLIIETDHHYQLATSHQLDLGLYYTNNRAFTKNYPNDILLEKWAAFIAYTKIKRVHSDPSFHVSLRQEFQNGLNAFTGKIGGEIVAFNNYVVLFNVSKNFRFPTLNDLYFVPGGNLNLQPENAYQQEVSFKSPTHSFLIGRLDWQAALHNTFVRDWILWAPQNSGTWSPQNISKVWARGFDLNVKWQYDYSVYNIRYESAFFYTQSTNQNQEDVESYEKQLIYTPLLKWNNRFTIVRKKTELSMSGQLIGERFITSDSKRNLPSYFLCDIFLMHEFLLKNSVCKFSFQIANAFNEAYQSISLYAQPLRSFQTSFQFSL